MSTSIIIPAYNEEKRLGMFLDSIQGYLEDHPDAIQEIIVIDDGSSDGTVTIAEEHFQTIPQLRLIKHEVNQGKGAAVRTGILAAQSDYSIFIDADGATPITELPKMTAALATHDIGIGNRWMPGAQTERHSLLRQLSGWIYRTYMKAFGLGSIDTMCGFKGYQHDVAKKLFANLQEQRWLFDTEIAYRAVQAGYSIKNFPITWESKDGSKLNTSTLVKSAWQIYPLIQRLKKHPPKL